MTSRWSILWRKYWSISTKKRDFGGGSKKCSILRDVIYGRQSITMIYLFISQEFAPLIDLWVVIRTDLLRSSGNVRNLGRGHRNRSRSFCCCFWCWGWGCCRRRRLSRTWRRLLRRRRQKSEVGHSHFCKRNWFKNIRAVLPNLFSSGGPLKKRKQNLADLKHLEEDEWS